VVCAHGESVGLYVEQELILLDAISYLHMPLDNLALGLAAHTQRSPP